MSTNIVSILMRRILIQNNAFWSLSFHTDRTQFSQGAFWKFNHHTEHFSENRLDGIIKIVQSLHYWYLSYTYGASVYFTRFFTIYFTRYFVDSFTSTLLKSRWIYFGTSLKFYADSSVFTMESWTSTPPILYTLIPVLIPKIIIYHVPLKENI